MNEIIWLSPDNCNVIFWLTQGLICCSLKYGCSTSLNWVCRVTQSHWRKKNNLRLYQSYSMGYIAYPSIIADPNSKSTTPLFHIGLLLCACKFNKTFDWYNGYYTCILDWLCGLECEKRILYLFPKFNIPKYCPLLWSTQYSTYRNSKGSSYRNRSKILLFHFFRSSANQSEYQALQWSLPTVRLKQLAIYLVSTSS